MKASDILVKALENEGVKYAFGIPGEETLDILESLRTSSIKFISTRHEQAAGFMAATVGRLTGKAGVCLATLGPGATNLATAAAYANLGGMPVLMITGQKPIHKSKQGHFQIVNAVEAFRPLTKFTKQIVSASSIPALVREAARTAEEERPGAAHLELPEDIAREDAVDAKPFPVIKTRRPAAEEKAVARAVEMIEDAKRPLILVGAGANRKLVSNSLLGFIEKTGIPFFNTQMGKGVIDERHPLYLGTAALSERDLVHNAIERADLIINVGHDVVEKPPFVMKVDGAQVIHVNFSSAKVDEIYFPQWEVVGDIGNALWQMTERIRSQERWKPVGFSKANKASKESGIEAIVAAVRRVVPEDGIVALDNGLYKLAFARDYPAYRQNTLLLDNALATMGAGLPSAIAAKLIYPEKKVLAVCGDGGFLMSGAELETAVRLGVNLTVLILNDGGYGMVRAKQRGMKFADFGLSLGNPDFARYAESFGARGYRAGDAPQLAQLLEKCLNERGVCAIEAPIDYGARP